MTHDEVNITDINVLLITVQCPSNRNYQWSCTLSTYLPTAVYSAHISNMHVIPQLLWDPILSQLDPYSRNISYAEQAQSIWLPNSNQINSSWLGQIPSQMPKSKDVIEVNKLISSLEENVQSCVVDPQLAVKRLWKISGPNCWSFPIT